MTKKLNPDPFEAIGRHWEKSQELFETWSRAAQEFWKSYVEFVSLLNQRNDKSK